MGLGVGSFGEKRLGVAADGGKIGGEQRKHREEAEETEERVHGGRGS